MPDVKLSQLAAASAASAAAGASLWTMPGHILGLRMEYVGPAAIRVSSGSAWIPSLQRAIEVPAALTLSGLTLAASTWYHLYLYLNGATPTIEAVTDAPADPYSGTARAKTGSASRRYVGSFRSNASGQIMNFVHDGSKVLYQGIFPQALTNGTATTETFVSLADSVPVTARVASLRHTNNSTSTASRMNNSSGPAYPAFLANFAPGADAFMEFVVNADKSVSYWNGGTPSPQGVYISVLGYSLER